MWGRSNYNRLPSPFVRQVGTDGGHAEEEEEDSNDDHYSIDSINYRIDKV